MSEATIAGRSGPAHGHHGRAPKHPDGRPDLDAGTHFAAIIIFFVLLAIGLAFATRGLMGDMASSGTPPLAVGAFVMLGLALLIALGFEFVNGFHDTANAVATVIYTHSMPAQIAVVWSGTFNFLGVMYSSGAVAFAVVSLLPVELILQASSGAGFAMIFSLLIAAIVWNLGTWYFGLPNSSSHTLVGSIIGVGLANQLMAEPGSGVSGVDWSQAGGVFKALLFSPVVGFIGSGLLLLAMKAVVRSKTLYTPPDAKKAPPLWIRILLIFTCTSVSFAHGSNDGQKGMGLIMLILIGALPTAYALNRSVPESHTPAFVAASQDVQKVFMARAGDSPAVPADKARGQVTDALKLRQFNNQATFAALGSLAGDIGEQVKSYGSLSAVPAAAVGNVRNDMFMVAEAIRLMQKSGSTTFSDADTKALNGYHKVLDDATKFIPLWVKVSVAVALGMGTMVGWKRIVVTVGEKIGKIHLTYGQGAAAELVAAVTIFGADLYGLPVSTTHVLTSGVAGTMAANGSGLQWGTLRNLAMAWILTLPAAILLAGSLYYMLRSLS